MSAISSANWLATTDRRQEIVRQQSRTSDVNKALSDFKWQSIKEQLYPTPILNIKKKHNNPERQTRKRLKSDLMYMSCEPNFVWKVGFYTIFCKQNLIYRFSPKNPPPSSIHFHRQSLPFPATYGQYKPNCFSGTLEFYHVGIILIYYVPFSPIIISVFLLFYRLENLSIGHP